MNFRISFLFVIVSVFMIFTTGFALGASYNGIDGFSGGTVTDDGLWIFKEKGGGKGSQVCASKSISSNYDHNEVTVSFYVHEPAKNGKIPFVIIGGDRHNESYGSGTATSIIKSKNFSVKLCLEQTWMGTGPRGLWYNDVRIDVSEYTPPPPTPPAPKYVPPPSSFSNQSTLQAEREAAAIREQAAAIRDKAAAERAEAAAIRDKAEAAAAAQKSEAALKAAEAQLAAAEWESTVQKTGIFLEQLLIPTVVGIIILGVIVAIARRKKKQVINPPPTRSGGTTNQQTCGNCDYLLPPRKSTEKSMKCPNCGFANTF